MVHFHPLRPSSSLFGFGSGLFTQHLIKEKSVVHIAAISLKLSPGPSYYIRPFLFKHTMPPSPFSFMHLEQQNVQIVLTEDTTVCGSRPSPDPRGSTDCLSQFEVSILQRGETDLDS